MLTTKWEAIVSWGKKLLGLKSDLYWYLMLYPLLVEPQNASNHILMRMIIPSLTPGLLRPPSSVMNLFGGELPGLQPCRYNCLRDPSILQHLGFNSQAINPSDCKARCHNGSWARRPDWASSAQCRDFIPYWARLVRLRLPTFFSLSDSAQ